MITNYDCIQPMAKVKRWSKEQKEKIDVPQPRLFAAYNNAMGGVDLLDQAVNNYRVTMQGKKWWWPLWTHMLNVSVVNAWRLHSLVNNNTKVDLLQFVREITRYYLRNFENTASKEGHQQYHEA
jgi:N-glycosylase/DNA lyase